jgi:hypothetical protein
MIDRHTINLTRFSISHPFLGAMGDDFDFNILLEFLEEEE